MSVGRKRTPVARQIAAGDPRMHGKNKLLEKLAALPKATKGLPTCPKHLKGAAREMWDIWVEELEVMGLDRRPDAAALAQACIAYQVTVEASNDINKRGIVIGSRGNPWLSIRERHQNILRQFCAEFGFTPSSRERLTAEKRDDAVQDLAALLSNVREEKNARSITSALQ